MTKSGNYWCHLGGWETANPRKVNDTGEIPRVGSFLTSSLKVSPCLSPRIEATSFQEPWQLVSDFDIELRGPYETQPQPSRPSNQVSKPLPTHWGAPEPVTDLWTHSEQQPGSPTPDL